MLNISIALLKRIVDRLGGTRVVLRGLWAVIILASVAGLAVSILSNWQSLVSYDWNLDWSSLLLGSLTYPILLLMTTLVWASLMRTLTGTPGTAMHVRYWCLTNLANRLPTPAPFLTARSETYAARGVPRSATLTATGVELVANTSGATLVAVVTLPFGPGQLLGVPALAVLGTALLVVGVLLSRPHLINRVADFVLVRSGRQPLAVAIRPRQLLGWTITYAIIWALSGVLRFLLAGALYPIGVENVFFIVNVFAVAGLVSWLSQYIFVLPGIGLHEIAVTYLLSSLVPVPVAAAIAIFTRLTVMVFELLWAGLAYTIPTIRR